MNERMRGLRVLVLAPVLMGSAAWMYAPGRAEGQAGATTPRQSGTVKAVTPKDFVLTGPGGQDIAVTVPDQAQVLLVPPGSRDLKSAKAGTMSDVATGDRVIVNGSAGDAGITMTATRVIVMKSGAIEASRAADEAAWQRGVGGIVKAVDASAIQVSSGMRAVTVNVTPATTFRRYAPGSVNFADAQKSTEAVILPGDQLRARGQRSADGNSLTAEEIVTGLFSNYSGVLSGVDTTAGTVTLKDLATKKTVTVAVTPQSNLRNLPASMAAGLGRGTGGAAGQGAGSSSGSGAAQAQQGGSGRTGMDLSRMLPRLPTQTLPDLKPGEAVMVVASGAQGSQPTAVTLLSGVEQILAAAPSGDTTLSPWNFSNSTASEAGGGAEPPPGR